MADFVETVRSGNVEAVQALLVAGSDPNAVTADKRTGLHEARSVEMVQALLDARADVNARDYNNYTPMHWMIEELIPDYGRATDPECIPLMLAAGSDPNTFDCEHATPLMCAVANDSRETVELLLEAGAKTEWTELQEMATALYFAEDPEIVGILLDAGAHHDHRDEWRRSPLHHRARYAEQSSCVEVLLAGGADVNARSGSGNTPLHEAAETGAMANAQILIDAGADRAARNHAGKTAAELAKTSEMCALCVVATKKAGN